jgi:hypothetical protein
MRLSIFLSLLFYLLCLPQTKAVETTRPVPNPRRNVGPDQSIRPIRRPPAEAYNPSAYGAARACDQFINRDGDLGPWGQALQDAIQRVGQDCFFNEARMQHICPQFSSFPIDRKMQFYAFLFGSIAFYESSCDETKKNRAGENGVASGLFQLEESPALRAASGRSRTFCAPGREVNVQSLSFQLECTLSIFKAGYCDDRVARWVGLGNRNSLLTGQPVRDFEDDDWYWEVLNGPEHRGTQMVQNFPGCAAEVPPELEEGPG